MLAWQRARPGERLLEVDVPLSYGMVDVSQTSPSKNSLEFMWDPTKEVGVYIKVSPVYIGKIQYYQKIDYLSISMNLIFYLYFFDIFIQIQYFWISFLEIFGCCKL